MELCCFADSPFMYCLSLCVSKSHGSDCQLAVEMSCLLVFALEPGETAEHPGWNSWSNLTYCSLLYRCRYQAVAT